MEEKQKIIRALKALSDIVFNIETDDIHGPTTRAELIARSLEMNDKIDENHISYLEELANKMKPSWAKTNPKYTTKRAAELLGMTDSGIRRMIQRGKIPAIKYGHDWLIAEGDLENVKKSQAGRPRKASQ